MIFAADTRACSETPSATSRASSAIAPGPCLRASRLTSAVAWLGVPALRPPRRSPGFEPGNCVLLLPHVTCWAHTIRQAWPLGNGLPEIPAARPSAVGAPLRQKPGGDAEPSGGLGHVWHGHIKPIGNVAVRKPKADQISNNQIRRELAAILIASMTDPDETPAPETPGIGHRGANVARYATP